MKISYWFVFITIILGFTALLVGINNHYFYKNVEIQTLKEMEREANQLQVILLSCYQFDRNCESVAKAFIKASSIEGKVILQKDNSILMSQDLEFYKDDRSVVKYSKDMKTGKNNFNINFEKKVAPSISRSVWKSMTFSILDWKKASLNFTSAKSFNNFFTEVAIPRSRPALFYLAFVVFIFGLIYIFIQVIINRWDLLEKHNQKLNVQLNQANKESKIYKNEIKLLNDNSAQITEQLDSTQKQLADILVQKTILQAKKEEVENKIKAQTLDSKNQYELYQSERNIEIKNLLKSHDMEKKELILEQQRIDEKYRVKIEDFNIKMESDFESLQSQTVNLSEKLKEIDEEKQISDLLVIELETMLVNVQNDVKQKDNQITALLKVIDDIEINKTKTRDEQQSLASNIATKEFSFRFLIKDPNITLKPVGKIIYNPNDHHGNDFVTELNGAISKKCDLTRFIKSVQSTRNRGYNRNTIILKKEFKNNNHEFSHYVAIIVSKHDAGYALNVILTASTQWEAVAQTKIIRMFVNSISKMPIIEKFGTSI